MTQQRSDDEIRADVRYLNDHEAQTGRRSSAHVLLTHDVEPLLARVSELEQANGRLLREAIRAEAKVRAVEGICRARVESVAFRPPSAARFAQDVLDALAALSGLSLQEEQE